LKHGPRSLTRSCCGSLHETKTGLRNQSFGVLSGCAAESSSASSSVHTVLPSSDAVVLPQLATPSPRHAATPWQRVAWTSVEAPVSTSHGQPTRFCNHVTYALASLTTTCKTRRAAAAKLVCRYYAGVLIEPRLSIVTLDHACLTDQHSAQGPRNDHPPRPNSKVTPLHSSLPTSWTSEHTLLYPSSRRGFTKRSDSILFLVTISPCPSTKMSGTWFS
jgi:hypothetical protein